MRHPNISGGGRSQPPLRFREIILMLVVFILSLLLIFSNIVNSRRAADFAAEEEGDGYSGSRRWNQRISSGLPLDSLEKAVDGPLAQTKGNSGNNKDGAAAAAAVTCPTCVLCPTCPPPQESLDNMSSTNDAITPAPYVLRINVFTYNRLEGLERLMNSLKNSFYPNVDPRSGQLPMYVYFDYPAKKDMALDGTREFLDTFHWPYGPLVILRREKNVGLRRNILESWYPAPNGKPIEEMKEFAAFFEDDLEVSPYWFVWADRGIREYSTAFSGVTKDTEKMLGLSLYRCIKDELSGKMVPFSDNEPFLLQQPSSWGAVFFPTAWREFRQWVQSLPDAHDPILRDSRDPSIDPSSNGWSHTSSWKKYLIYLMYKKGWFMVYPNLPDRTVLSTNHLMKGVHPTPNRKLYNLPIFPPSSMLPPEEMRDLIDRKPLDPLRASPRSVVNALMKFPPLDEMAGYDVMHAKRGRGPKSIPNNRK